METLYLIKMVAVMLFLVFCCYQFIYIAVILLHRKKECRKAEMTSRYAVLICARNEEKVIAELIDSIHSQSYPQEKLKVFVMADNCTDGTAEAARESGAAVYERSSDLQGKGYALEALLGRIHADEPEGFDGYFVFDADNILKEDYIECMNDTFCQGYDIVTSYRNSKNYGDNWISAGYSLWFLRESRFLNEARFLTGSSAAVSGTGFLFSRRIAEEIGTWPYHLLTEDIEFTADQITKGRKIAFCAEAEFYDEQPVLFSQSVIQRMRWAKGYLQVIGAYGGKLLAGILKGNFSCYDMVMSNLPAFAVTFVSLFCDTVILIQAVLAGNPLPAISGILRSLAGMYLSMFVIGLVTLVHEREHVPAARKQMIQSLFTFPLFMFTYIPVSAAAVFSKPQWKPVAHTVSFRNPCSGKRKTVLKLK